MAKYFITIADIDLNIITEESKETVDALVRDVDTRIRTIASRSSRLSKSEASILCALDYRAECIKTEARAKASEKDLADMSAELEALKKDYANLASETEELRRENRVMNDIISKNISAGVAATAAAQAMAQGEQLAIETDIAPIEEQVPAVPATEVMFDSEDTEAPAQEEEAPKKRARRVRAKKTSATGKNKVGDMFDMLTFKDV